MLFVIVDLKKNKGPSFNCDQIETVLSGDIQQGAWAGLGRKRLQEDSLLDVSMKMVMFQIVSQRVTRKGICKASNALRCSNRGAVNSLSV